LTTDLVRKLNNRVSNLSEVGKLYSSFLDRELSPWLDAFVLMVETQFKRASRHKTISSWQEVESND
jgi:hypothetical protein